MAKNFDPLRFFGSPGHETGHDAAAGAQRLVFVNRFFHPDASATSQLLSDLAFHLAERGFDVRVVASRRQREGAAAELPASENVRGVGVHRVAMPELARFGLTGRVIEYAFFYLGAAAALRRQARAGDILIAKSDPPMIAVLAGAVAWSRGAALVTWMQDIYPEAAARLGVPILRGPIVRVLEALRDAALKRAAMNVAIGELMAALMVARGAPQGRLRVIPNWTDDETIAASPAGKNTLRARHGLETAFIVGYSGNLGRAHEYKTLLEAADLLRSEKGLVFLHIGAGILVEPFREAVRARGLDGAFLFLPVQPRAALGDALSAPDVHWLSLRPELEGLIVPSKFYGAAAAGRPVLAITAKDGEIARVVREGGCGIVVEPGCGAELAEAILRLRADPQLCETMGKNARALIESQYSKVQALARWSALFDGLRAERGSLPPSERDALGNEESA